MRKIYLLLLMAIITSVSYSQVAMTITGSYTQDFNTLPASGSATWFNNGTIPSWYHQRSGTGTTIVANDGSSNAGNLYSYGTGTATDRALGVINSGNGAIGNMAYGVLLRNTSGTTISSITISYTAEQWRNSAAAAQSVTFYYRASSSAIAALDPNVPAGWTGVATLSFTSPITAGVAAAINGNLAANKVAISSAIPSLSLANNDYIMLKWDDPDHTGADHGLSIDDVTISWTVSAGSSATDYFRSAASGNWSAATTWESSADNSTWIPATLSPDANSASISIRNGHNVTIDVASGGDQLTVNTGGILTLGTNFTLANGTGADLTINAGGELDAGTNQVTGAGDALINGTLATSNMNGISATGSLAFSGTTTFGASSVVEYRGAAGQAVTARTDYQSLKINGTGSKVLDGPATVNGVLDFSTALGFIVTTSSNLLTLTENATILMGSYVDGPLARTTNSTGAYLFPVGKAGTIRSFEVIPASTDVTTFNAEYFGTGIHTTSMACDITRMFGYTDNQYWDISRAAGIANARIRLNYVAANSNGSWRNGSSPILNPGPGTGITIAHYNSTSACWQDENGTPLAGTSVSGPVTSRVMNSFSPFTFGYGPLNVLPVAFGNVRATQQGSNVKIDWSNYTESDILNYTIERSADGRRFNAVGIVVPVLNDRTRADYSITDASPVKGINYYRVRAAETSGDVKYSSVVRVDLRGNRTEISLYPNPLTGNNLSLQATSLAKGQYNIKVFNATGQQVAGQVLTHNGGSVTEPVLLQSALKAGLYQLVITSDAMNVTKTFVVQ